MLDLHGTVPICVVVDEVKGTVEKVIVFDELVSDLHSEDAPGSEAERRALEIIEEMMWPVWQFGA